MLRQQKAKCLKCATCHKKEDIYVCTYNQHTGGSVPETQTV